MKILNFENHSDTLYSITVDANGIANTYQQPGQYIVANMPNQKPLFLVISSPIGSEHWDFLVRARCSATQALQKHKVGDSLEISKAQGKGYPMELLKNKNIILISAGTGLAAFYSAIQQILENRSAYGDILLYHGSRYEEEIPYREEMQKWVQAGIQVFLTLSQPNDSWPFYEGHVQKIFDHEKPDLHDYVALICGPKQMVEDVSKYTLQFGLDSKAIYYNY